MSCGGCCRFRASMRLKRQTDVRRVFHEGVAWTGTLFVLHVRPRPEGSRLGIVIGRRYGTAVERNRAKRKIREAFRRSVGRLPRADIIVRPTAACREASVDEMMELLARGADEAMQREEPR